VAHHRTCALVFLWSPSSDTHLLVRVSKRTLYALLGTAFPDYNYIEWQTYSEHNSSHFLLEKSSNGETWDTLSTTPASGNSVETINYSQLDNNIDNIIYYRLTQFDIDGEFEMFGPIVIQRNITKKSPIKYINTMGQEIDPINAKGLIITVYSDGSITKTIK